MRRSINFLLRIGISALRRWGVSFPLSSPRIESLFPPSSVSSLHDLHFSCLRPGWGGLFGAFHTSSGGSESSRAGDADATPTVSCAAASYAKKSTDSFCRSCGSLTKKVIPDGDERMRAVCTICGKIHYENPKMVVGCLVEHAGKVLLCKRKIQPSYGLWTLPAGFLELGESAAEGATRETFEEANAEVEVTSPFAQLDIPLIGRNYMMFRAKMNKPHFSPGPESLECMLYSPDDIPFDSIAFSSMYVTLKMYVEDIKNKTQRFHYCTIKKKPGSSPCDPNGFDLENHIQS